MTQPEDVPLPGLTPQTVLRRLKKDMPQDAPIKEDGKVVGYEENGIEGALNQLYSYDKEALVSWFLDLPIEDLPDDDS